MIRPEEGPVWRDASNHEPWHRAANTLFWLAPVIFLVWLYADGLNCWFIADDFAWLGLLRRVHNPRDLLDALFSPAAQGTIRPWSERGFFLAFESLFGLDALPFRIMAFATMAANLTLLAWIVRRITRSRLAGAVAAVCWAANAALTLVMTWNSAFNQALCALFLLAALALFIRYAETGSRKFWWWQLVVFTLGFGALEVNVVYPALAASWALFVAFPAERRRLLLSVIPLGAVSIAYFLIHCVAAPLPDSGVYKLQLDWRMFGTLLFYGRGSLLPVDWEAFSHSHRMGRIILWVCFFALAGLAAAEFRRRRTVTLFFAAWFLIALAPVLPLREHRSDYYLAIPLIGLGMLAGWAIGCAWRGATRGRLWQAGAAVPLILYLSGMIPVARSATRWWLEKTVPVRGVVLGVRAARATHPGKSILIDGVRSNLYYDSLGQGALGPLGIDDVYLTPGSELNIRTAPDLVDIESMVPDPAAAMHAIRKDQIVVYSVAGDHLRNITTAWERSAPNRLIANALRDRLPSRLDAGNPLYAWLLGPEWLPPLNGVRWMPGRATLRLRGPLPGNKLAMEGYCPPEQLRGASRHLLVSVDGISIGRTQISDPETSFHRLFAIPESLLGRDSVTIELVVNPVGTRGSEQYGLVFGRIAFRAGFE
jgi:hypothetical protein